jgi:hypothetical protein
MLVSAEQLSCATSNSSSVKKNHRALALKYWLGGCKLVVSRFKVGVHVQNFIYLFGATVPSQHSNFGYRSVFLFFFGIREFESGYGCGAGCFCYGVVGCRLWELWSSK